MADSLLKFQLEKKELEQRIRKELDSLCRAIEECVPEEGAFKQLKTPKIEVKLDHVRLTHVELTVSNFDYKLPVGQQYRRLVEINGYNLPCPYMANRNIILGNKQKVIDYLRSEEALYAIYEEIFRLEYDLSDV